ncbi:hypothetical protein ANCCAN_21268 [Ancylostoma caninum]|uniref:Uncharacterized protein n=1 Tax=Ancylostoma caninum TaxID=29170 RepID=A0A368FL12_ANCCA|nr:hypothetical protein ANCCAN_21268 [Ancylostoma caninum]
MPPKRKSRTGATPVRGEGRTTRSSAKKAKADHSDSEKSASSDDEKPFDKGTFMSVMRYDFEDLLTSMPLVSAVLLHCFFVHFSFHKDFAQ